MLWRTVLGHLPRVYESGWFHCLELYLVLYQANICGGGGGYHDIN